MKPIIVIFLLLISSNHIRTDESGDQIEETADDSGIGPNGGQCTADEILEQVIGWLTPDDYDEGKANIQSELRSFNDTLRVMNRLGEYSRNVSEKLSEFSKRVNARLSEVLMEVDLSSDCLKSFVRIGSAIKNGDLWALKFLDAQPKPNNGLMELTGLPFGNFDQCLSIESPDDPNEPDLPKIRGQYCGTTIKPLLTLSSQPKPEDYPAWAFESLKKPGFGRKMMQNLFTNLVKTSDRRTHEDWLTFISFMETNVYDTKMLNGICIPTTCTPQEISKVMNKMTYPITHIPLSLHDECDYIGKPVKLNKFHIISITGIAIMLTIFFVSSAIDFMDEKSLIRRILKGTVMEFIIQCFSLKRNSKLIFSIAQDGKFKSLDGLRAILTFFVVVLHTYEFGLVFIYNKNHYLSGSYKMIKDYRNMFLPNILLMDNFLIISAFLLGNTMLSRVETSRGRFNYLNYLIFRYLRLLPIILFGLAATFIFELLGSGPVWSFVVEYFTKPCYDKWHKPLLMYNNHEYYAHENSTILSSIQCLTVTWYSSCDFQLYAFAPISWLALYKLGPKKGLIWNGIVLAIAVLAAPFMRLVLKLPHVYEILGQTNFKTLMMGWEWHYWAPINYFQTYIIGILVAYAVRRYPKAYLGGRLGESFIWLITISSTVTILYWQRNFMVPGYPYDAFGGLEMPLYLLTHKIMYLPAFGWLMYACETGRGGWLYKALCWQAFKFFDNVTVEIYILHVFAFVYRIGVRRDQITYYDYNVWTFATFDYVATYLISVCVALVITKPFFNITQALLIRDKADPIVDNKSKNFENGLDNPVFTTLEEKDIKALNAIHVSSDKVIYRM